MIVAHQGASQDAPGNTIPAFKLAWEQGADAIEGDFHLTQDGYIVCIHDGNTERVSHANFVIRDTPLAELRKLDVGIRRGREFKGTVIPTIAEVFETIPRQKIIYVEIKCGPEMIPPLLKQIRQSGLTKEQIVTISFNREVIQELKNCAPQYKALWLSNFMKDKSGKRFPSLETVLSTLTQTRADGLDAAKNFVDGDFIRGVRDKGFEFHVWTVDDASTAGRFRKWGAQSITTNVPGVIRQHFSGQGDAACAGNRADALRSGLANA